MENGTCSALSFLDDEDPLIHTRVSLLTLPLNHDTLQSIVATGGVRIFVVDGNNPCSAALYGAFWR